MAKIVSDLYEKFDTNTLKEEITEEVARRFKKQSYAPTNKGKMEGLSINNIVEKILCFNKNIDVPNKESVNVTHKLLFETTGDSKSMKDKEYNKIRDAFVKTFGSLVARNICYYHIKMLKIDWLKGVLETDIAKMVANNFIVMVTLLHHKDLDPTWGIEVSFTQDGDFFYKLGKLPRKRFRPFPDNSL